MPPKWQPPFFFTQGDGSSSFLSESCHEDPSVSPNFTPPNPQALKWWPPSFRPGRTGWEGSLLREGWRVAIPWTGIMDLLLCSSAPLSPQSHRFLAPVPSHSHNALHTSTCLPLAFISSSLFSLFLTQIPFLHIIFFPFLFLFLSSQNWLPFWPWSFSLTLTLLFPHLKH